MSWRPLAGVLSAQAVAWTGTRLSAIALPWFVLTTTGSATQTGVIVFAEMAPYVLAQLLSGPLIDRVGPSRISVTGDLVSMVAVALIPALFALGLLHFGLLIPLVAVVGTFRGPADAAKTVFLPDATRAARVPLERGTGIAATIERLASTVGPAVAGVVVAAVGGPYALVVTAVLFGSGALIVAFAAPRQRPPTPAEAEAEDGYFRRLRAGMTFLRQDRLLRSMAGMIAVTNLLDAAWTSVLLPVWARDSGHGPATIGLLLGVLSGCAALSALVAAGIAHRLPRRPVYLIGFLLDGFPRFLPLALGAPLEVTILVYAVCGFGSGFINPIVGAIQFERAPQAMYGRIRTLLVAVAWSGIPFGGLAGGLLVARLGLSPALLACGAVYLLVTTIPAVLPGMRDEWSRKSKQDKEVTSP
ncbi:MAG TPA: MFS transporter [Amycolatopsis sp.]